VRIAIGSDHAGYRLKEFLRAELAAQRHDLHDFGAHSTESVDYPDIAGPLARSVVAGEADLGIVVCSNGVGVSIAANKVPGGRAALCHDAWSAGRARAHTDANILALGGQAVGEQVALEIVRAFLGQEFEGGRHARRVAKIEALEDEYARD
jgi:ribose 5-phosphate isomerase B